MGFGNLSGPGFSELVAHMRHEYHKLCDEGCGICEERGDLGQSGFVYWYTKNRSSAHFICIQKIGHLEKNLNRTILDLFHSNQLNKSESFTNFKRVHIQAIEAVKNACGSETLLSYLEKNGETCLAHLFDTIGIEAAKQMVAKL